MVFEIIDDVQEIVTRIKNTNKRKKDLPQT